MWKLKGCPRCKGDLLKSEDHFGWREWCLQCGYLRELPSIIEVPAQILEERKVVENV